MKNKTKKCKTGGPLYANGGQLFDTIGQLSPLLGLIPGVGQVAAPLVGMGASFLSNKAKQAQDNNNGLNATGYTNSNAFGYADGGSLQSLNSTSKLVTGAPNEIDGNQINYKGASINLNHGETLDINRDRVISDKYINPETGKKIIDEDKRLKNLRGKAEKIYANTADIAAKNTIKRLQEQEDNLYNIQEQVATMKGDRNTDGTTVQKGQRYADGGPLKPKDNNAFLIEQMASLIRQINQPKQLEESTKPELFPETVDYNGTVSKVTNYPNTVIDNKVPDNNKVSTPKSRSVGSSKIKELQRILVEKGYDNVGHVGVKNDIDGILGNRTKAALRDALASGKLDKSYESYLNMPSRQSKLKASNRNAVANKVAETKSNNIARSFTDEPLPEYIEDKASDYKFNTDIDWQKMMANSKQKPIYMPEPKKKKEKSIGVADLIYGKYFTGGTLKSYAPGGYIDPLDPLALRPLGQVMPSYDFGVAPRSINNMSVTGGTSNQPGLNNVGSIVNGIGQSTVGSTGGSNIWNDMTMGEKVGMGSAALSVALKATDAFGKVQKEPYRYNNAPISLNQLDPTAVINNNQASYESALNDLNNSSTTGSNRQAIAANLFNNKLRANNDVMTKYGEQNSNLATQYEQRLAQRNSENNQMSYQVDDLNSRNKGAAQQMRSGVYSDLSTLGLDQANILNNRMSQQATLEALKKMAPDVYENLMKNIKLK